MLVVVACLGAGGWYAYGRTKSAAAGSPQKSEGLKALQGVSAEVTHPRPGGIRREVTQPGTVEPFESAEIYANVSGYLASQRLERDGKPVLGKDGKPVLVDIGTRVKAGDVLARISVPEYQKQVERDEAKLRDSKAKVAQMEAHQRAAEAEARAADASVVLSQVMVKAKTAYRHYREKQLERIKGLYASSAVEAKLVDEQEDYFLSAQEAENAAKEQVNTNREKASAARAKIDQAKADVDEAKAEVGVAEAELAKSKVLLDYCTIKSEYTGVITKRNFHVGDFIKAADQGGDVPMLAVERTDLMRVVIQVPDRDVPYVDAGDPAVIEIDALPGAEYRSRDDKKIGVSRWADAEDPATRTMRTEVDVPNPDGKLRHGMYGKATLILDEGHPNAVRIPSAALVGKAEGGKGAVRVVRGGKVELVPVRYDSDNGVDVEIISGLTTADQVIVRTSAPVEAGTPVTVTAPGSGH
jgi:RND family efflux transporter MFP subunit